jgi:hypothetical protein
MGDDDSVSAMDTDDAAQQVRLRSRCPGACSHGRLLARARARRHCGTWACCYSARLTPALASASMQTQPASMSDTDSEMNTVGTSEEPTAEISATDQQVRLRSRCPGACSHGQCGALARACCYSGARLLLLRACSCDPGTGADASPHCVRVLADPAAGNLPNAAA